MQTHIKAARSNDQARARAFAELSISEVRFPLVGEALRDECGADAPAVMADFPAVALEEAATAFGFQLPGLHILHASAKVHTSARHNLVTSYLSDRFDEKASDLIRDRKVKFDLNPLELAMGCYPILQLALQLYYMHHSPIAPSSSPIVEIAKSVKLLKGTVFNPARGLDAFFAAHAAARADKLDYDYNAVFGHLVHAVNDTSGVSYFKFDDDGLSMLLNWRAWATKTSLDHRQHLALGSAAPPYAAADVTRLNDGLRRFAEAIDLEQADREVIATLGTTNAVVAVEETLDT